jgi:hypothetical protein
MIKIENLGDCGDPGVIIVDGVVERVAADVLHEGVGVLGPLGIDLRVFIELS